LIFNAKGHNVIIGIGLHLAQEIAVGAVFQHYSVLLLRMGMQRHMLLSQSPFSSMIGSGVVDISSAMFLG
jgi:hypothetical protein